MMSCAVTTSPGVITAVNRKAPTSAVIPVRPQARAAATPKPVAMIRAR